MSKRPDPQPPSVRRVPLDSLKPDAGNTRKRDDRARRALAESVRTFGPARSIVLDGADVVRAGNGTIDAARAAGVKEVLIVEAGRDTLVAVKRPDWTATEARAYGIADNRTQDLSEFDSAALAATVDDLRAEGFDVGKLELDTQRDVDQVTADDLKEWDATQVELAALFTFKAPIELQPKIRELLRKSFPGVSFEEDVIYG